MSKHLEGEEHHRQLEELTGRKAEQAMNERRFQERALGCRRESEKASLTLFVMGVVMELAMAFSRESEKASLTPLVMGVLMKFGMRLWMELAMAFQRALEKV
jgi:hypothetical protein